MHKVFYYTYIVASRTHALYIGMTNDIERRVTEHKGGKLPGFSAQYRCNRLVWFERYTSPGTAIAREKQLKGWRRSKKLILIEQENPTWIDWSEDWGKNYLKKPQVLRLRLHLRESFAQEAPGFSRGKEPQRKSGFSPGYDFAFVLNPAPGGT